MPGKSRTNKELKAIVSNAIGKHGTHADAFIPILLEVDRQYGYIPAEAIQLTRQRLHESGRSASIPLGRLYGLASFYDMLSTEKRGRHLVQFCENAPCHVQGGRELMKAIQETLQLHPGETSADERFTFKTVSCLGLCAMGPVLLVDDDHYSNVIPEQLACIFAKYE